MFQETDTRPKLASIGLPLDSLVGWRPVRSACWGSTVSKDIGYPEEGTCSLAGLGQLGTTRLERLESL